MINQTSAASVKCRIVYCFVFKTAALTMAAAGILASNPALAASSRKINDQQLEFHSSEEMNKYLTIGSSEVHEIPTKKSILRLVSDLAIIANPSTPVPPSTLPTTLPTAPPPNVHIPGASGSAGSLDPSQIMPWITLGEKIWALIAANKPVVSVQTKRAFILPVAEQDWTQMENWKGPAVHTYRLEYKNLYGSTVITHTYTIAYNYGGTYNEAGQFLANVTVIPSTVNVAWGYTLNTSVELGDAVNTASKSSPVPGIEIQIITKVDTVLKHAETRDAFFVKGSGECQSMTPPSATLVP